MYDIRHLHLRIHKENVTFYGYRKALPKVRLVFFEREDSEIKELEENLYKVTGEMKDNHVLFELTLDEYSIALQFTDSNMWIGIGVEKRCW